MHFERPPVPPPGHVDADRIVDFDIYNLPDAADTHSAWASLNADEIADVVWTPRNGGHWIVTKGPLISDAYKDYKSFGSHINLVPKDVGEQYHFVPNSVDPPDHRQYRELLSRGLSPGMIDRLEPTVRELSAELVAELAPRGNCDFVADYAEILPVRIFMEMCGLPAEDGLKLKHWADQFTRPDGTMTIEEATEALYDYLKGPIAARQKTPTEDFLSQLVNDGDEPLPLDKALALSAQVLLGGLDTVVNFLGFMMHHLATHPRDRAAIADGRIRPSRASTEFLRRFPLATSARVVNHDMAFGGAELRSGDMIVIPSILHGLDPRENADPLAVDFDRPNIRHSTFGNGVHRCPGSFLARAEIEITLEEWLARIPDFSLAPDPAITFRGGVVAALDRLPLVWTAHEGGGS